MFGVINIKFFIISLYKLIKKIDSYICDVRMYCIIQWQHQNSCMFDLLTEAEGAWLVRTLHLQVICHYSNIFSNPIYWAAENSSKFLYFIIMALYRIISLFVHYCFYINLSTACHQRSLFLTANWKIFVSFIFKIELFV